MSGKKPEWAEENEDGFTSSVQEGVKRSANSDTKVRKFVKKQGRPQDIKELKQGILLGERAKLARAITLIESNASQHFEYAQCLLQSIMTHTGKSIRIGISGVPGAGKSTFIEAFGTFLCQAGHKVAVLAVDPSSSINGGSILGDKTRMEELARNPLAFIRPSPSEGTLGGVHRKTRETMLLCEAAGFDVILVETVGVGQSEAIVRGMVDLFLLLALTGAGDELQGMKKGILELVDVILVNKADGSNKTAALRTKSEYSRILHFLKSPTKGWQAKSLTCSSLNGEGIPALWDVIGEFTESTKQSGVFEERRRMQAKEWMYSLVNEQLQTLFFQNERIKRMLPQLENEVIAGEKTVTQAVHEAFTNFYEST